MKKILIFLFLAFGTLFAFEELTTNNFDQKIKGKNVLVDFHSPY